MAAPRSHTSQSTSTNLAADPVMARVEAFRRARQRFEKARAIDARRWQGPRDRRAEREFQASLAYSRTLRAMDAALADLTRARPITAEGGAAMLAIAAEQFTVKLDQGGQPWVMGPEAAVRIIEAVRFALVEEEALASLRQGMAVAFGKAHGCETEHGGRGSPRQVLRPAPGPGRKGKGKAGIPFVARQLGMVSAAL